MTIFLGIAFFLALLFFGWQAVRTLLGEYRIEHLVALGGIVGIGLYLFFVNISSLIIPAPAVFYFVLALCLLFAVGGSEARRLGYIAPLPPLAWGIDAPWRKAVIMFTLFLTVSVGLMSMRHIMDDASFRAPTAVTMAEGNLPPVQVWNPTSPFSYHYAPDLFVAAAIAVSGMPIYIAYDLLATVLSGYLFLLAILFVLEFFPRQFFVAFAAGLSMIYAGSLDVVNVFKGIPILYAKYVAGQDIEAPFKFLSDAIVGQYTSPVVNSLVLQHYGPMMFALILVVAYIYFYLLRTERTRRIGAYLVAGFLLALLALASEPYFAALSALLFFFPFGHYWYDKNKERAKKVFFVSFLLLLIAVPTAFIQGGFVRAALVEQFHLDFIKNPDETPLFVPPEGGRLFKITTPTILAESYGERFLWEMTLLVVLVIPALVFLAKRRPDLALFLGGAMLLCFLPPLLLASDYKFMTSLLWRFFVVLNLLAGLAIGTFLALRYQETKRPLFKGVIIGIALLLCAQGAFTQAVWLAVGAPPGRGWNEETRFFPQAGSIDAISYEWVREHTTVHDLFLLVKEDYKECGFASVPNCFFIYNTGRMAPIYKWGTGGNGSPDETTVPQKAAAFDALSQSCAADLVRELRYDYVYVDEFWPAGLEERCLHQNRLELVFDKSDEKDFVRIYKLDN